MPLVNVVGAGISGMVAAINLADKGYKVKIYEAGSRIGGSMQYLRPDPAGSPLDVKALHRFTGIDTGPALKPIDKAVFYGWGKTLELGLEPEWNFFMIERGSRPESLDSLLYDTAIKHGVEFEFNSPFASAKQLHKMPRNTIVATGMNREVYEFLGIPYVPMYAQFARGAANDDKTVVSLWMDRFTRDYAFYSTINGISFALLFQRGSPPSKRDMDLFRKRLSVCEGVELDEWRLISNGACPVASSRNPRLFQGDKILAGTLAGVIDPVLFFGMAGALVSGVIAANAVDDKNLALAQFQMAVRGFRPLFILKKAVDIAPESLKSFLVHRAAPAIHHSGGSLVTRWTRMLPGSSLLAADE